LLSRIETEASIDFLCPARVDKVQVNAAAAEVTLIRDGDPQVLRAGLVVVADGGDSAVRQQLGVSTKAFDYGQTAVVANVTSERAPDSTAYERFTATGPLAILPLGGHRCVVVWAVPTAEAQTLLAHDDATFLSLLGDRFGNRLGRFVKVGRRRSYPLRLCLAERQVGSRFVIIGNAAHTIHPNAAQGLNLGLRDAAALAECIADARRAGEDIASTAHLEKYAAGRIEDHRNVTRLSDGLARIFYNDIAPLVVARNLAMVAVDLVPPLKRRLVRQAMGLSGHQPRLVRGLAL
jgi:2-octaprenyl-6-methoxyphenol hydroxylase